MTNFEKSIKFVFNAEGGYSNNPDDRGGATNMGITQGTLSAARADGKIAGLPYSVKQLTRAQATEIYRIYYWERSKADVIPYPLCTLHFDAAVNHGVGGAGKLLQKTINNYANKAELDVDVCVDVDGAVGEKTLAALEACIAAANNISLICEIYCNYREAFYRDIVASRPEQKKFLNGWLNRLNRCRGLIG